MTKRDIKLRAWDMLENKYWAIESWHIEEEYVDLIEPNKNIADMTMQREWRRVSEVVIEEYTGLKDVNGVEVYEGDIVTCTKGCSHKVIWVEVNGGIFGGGMPGWYLSGLDNGYAWTREEKVIGNVHENLELLEV